MVLSDGHGYGALAPIWRTLWAHPQVKPVLVRSDGKAFCAGGELAMVNDMLQSEPTRQRALKEARQLVYDMLHCDKRLSTARRSALV